MIILEWTVVISYNKYYMYKNNSILGKMYKIIYHFIYIYIYYTTYQYIYYYII